MKITKSKNIKSSWNKGGHLTEEWKKRIGESNKISQKGKKLSEETIKKMTKSRMGHKVSEETRIKIGNAHRGKKVSEETKQLISKVQIGKKLSEETKQKIRNTHRGMKRSEETGKRISKALKGKLKPEGFGEKIRQIQLGKKLSIEIRKNISMGNKNSNKVRRGENHPSWKGGIWPINDKIKHSIEYILWRQSVITRDNWTCQKYGIKGDKLHAHHIKNFAEFPELRFAIDNGITFSKKAHDEFHKKYGYKNNTKEQVIEFIGEKYE